MRGLRPAPESDSARSIEPPPVAVGELEP
jgi:hypothetical protein